MARMCDGWRERCCRRKKTSPHASMHQYVNCHHAVNNVKVACLVLYPTHSLSGADTQFIALKNVHKIDFCAYLMPTLSEPLLRRTDSMVHMKCDARDKDDQ